MQNERRKRKVMSVEVKNLRKVYETNKGRNRYVALKDISFTIDRGEFVAIICWET